MMPTTGAGAMFQDSAFLSELEQAAGASGKNPEQALKYARKCLYEIEATPKDDTVKLTYFFSKCGTSERINRTNLA